MNNIAVKVDSHPLSKPIAFVTRFSQPLGNLETPPQVLKFLSLDCAAPVVRSEEFTKTTRQMLRHGGFKPAGRNKPAAEYLLKAATENTLASINLAVDLCNIVSLNSGIPVSVIDLDKIKEPFSIKIAPEKSEYIFNPSGQILKLDGLLCLFDSEGPCANAVKDAQRSKTDETTMTTLTVIWGASMIHPHVQESHQWYLRLLQDCQATVETVEFTI